MSHKIKNLNNEISSNSVMFLLVSIFALTIFIKTDFADPFNSAKFLLLLIISAWIFSHLINAYRVRRIQIISMESIIVSITLIFILSLLVSAVLTDNFISALIGETQRKNGFLTYLSLSIIFLYSIRAINFSNIIKIYKLSIVTGSVVSSYGILQISGRDFIPWDNPYNNMISTLGNPNFASALLSILTLMGFFSLFTKTLSVPFKLLAIYLICSSIFAIVESGSRQGLLVMIFSLLFYFSIYSVFKNKIVGVGITILFGIMGLLIILAMLQKGPLTSLIYKQSVSVRGYYWRAGLEMFKSNPLSGVGVDRYGDFFKFFREPSYALKYGFDITSNNAHNTFIQFFATSGFLVGISYLSIIFMTFYLGISVLRRCPAQSRPIVLGLVASWVGFQAQSLVSIDNIGISIWGWLYSGAIIGLKLSSDLSTKSENKNSFLNQKKTPVINLFQPSIFLLILIPTSIFCTSIYKVENKMYILKGISNPVVFNNKEIVLKYSKEIINSSLADPYLKYRSALYLYDMGYFEESSNVIDVLIKRNPNNLEFLIGKLFLSESQKDTDSTISIREKITYLDPWNANNYLELIQLYKTNNQLDKAVLMRDKILSFASGTNYALQASEMLG